MPDEIEEVETASLMPYTYPEYPHPDEMAKTLAKQIKDAEKKMTEEQEENDG